MTRYAEISYPPELILRQVGYQMHAPAVEAFHQSTAKYIFVSAPNQSSKSWATAHKVLAEYVFPPYAVEVDDSGKRVGSPVILRENQLIWIVGPDYSLCKEFDYLYDHLVVNRKVYGWDKLYTVRRGTGNNKRQGNLTIDLEWPGETPEGKLSRTIIKGMSATNEKTLQSEPVNVSVMSEAANQPARVFDQYLQPRSGRIIVPTTPKIEAAWIREYIENPTPQTQSFTFPPWSNPKYRWDTFKEHALKAESLIGKPNRYEWGYEGNLDRPKEMMVGISCSEEEPIFAETRLGSWTYASERVIPFCWEPNAFGLCHVEHRLPMFVENKRARFYVALDYGYDDPSAVGFWAVSAQGKKVLCTEIYESHFTGDDLVNRTFQRIGELGWWDVMFVGDPRKPDVNEQFQRRNMPVHIMNKNQQANREAGHMELVDNLAAQIDEEGKPGPPQLTILSDRCGRPYGCPQTIKEWKLLRRKKTVHGEFSPTSYEGNDHAYDMTRYFLMARPKGPRELVSQHSALTFDDLKARYKRSQRSQARIGHTVVRS